MNSLIKIDVNEKYEQVVSVRDLHEKLGIGKDFTDWFKYQTERLNLSEEIHFTTILGKSTGGRPSTDYLVPLEIAKHLCMISGGEMAWQIRDYFIQIERAWNTPEQVMARALQMSSATIKQLQQTVQLQAPKVLFADAVTASKSSVLVGELAKILRQNGVDIGQNRLFGWLRGNGYLCKAGENFNLPTQYAMDLGLCEIKKTTINKPDGSSFVTRTTKITGKGQVYFVSKFLQKEVAHG